MEPRNRFQGMNSASLCSRAGRYDNPLPLRCLAPIASLKFQLYSSYRPARLHRLAKSIPRNRFLASINIYKYGLSLCSWRAGTSKRVVLALSMFHKRFTNSGIGYLITISLLSEIYMLYICAGNYRPCFRENQPKRSFSIK
jgi:hypothetical protein